MRDITEPYDRTDALAALAAAIGTAGDLEWALATAHALANESQRNYALATLAEALSAHGDPKAAETVALTITDPGEQARVLTTLAQTAEPNCARALIGRALSVGDWVPLVGLVVQLQPTALTAITTEYLTSFQPIE